jgi:hypothetical protein
MLDPWLKRFDRYLRFSTFLPDSTRTLYFAYSERMNLIKIGYTKNLSARMDTISANHGLVVPLLEVTKSPRGTEQAFLAMMDQERCLLDDGHEREWFYPSEALLELIKLLSRNRVAGVLHTIPQMTNLGWVRDDNGNRNPNPADGKPSKPVYLIQTSASGSASSRWISAYGKTPTSTTKNHQEARSFRTRKQANRQLMYLRNSHRLSSAKIVEML